MVEFPRAWSSEQVEGDCVVFDYRLRSGMLDTTNAIAILERTGFPELVAAEARRLTRRP